MTQTKKRHIYLILQVFTPSEKQLYSASCFWKYQNKCKIEKHIILSNKLFMDIMSHKKMHLLHDNMNTFKIK